MQTIGLQYMVIMRSLDLPLWEASVEESATCKVGPVVQGSNHTGSVDIDDPKQSDHRRRTIHPLQLVYINATFPYHQLTNFKLFSMPMDLVVMIHPNFSHLCRTPSSSPYPCLSDHSY